LVHGSALVQGQILVHGSALVQEQALVHGSALVQGQIVLLLGLLLGDSHRVWEKTPVRVGQPGRQLGANRIRALSGGPVPVWGTASL
jgi:hypothetical protein